MSKNLLVVRVDANEQIGMGHLMRSLTVSIAVKSKNIDSIFLYGESKSFQVVLDNKFIEDSLDLSYSDYSLNAAQETLNYLNNKKSNKILIDSYYVTEEYINYLRNNGKKVICINSQRRFFPIDLLINYSIIYDKQYYAELYDKTNTTVLLGPMYAPLRNEFSVNEYILRDKVSEVLILTGGGDKDNFMGQFICKLSKKKEDYKNIHFTFISGNLNSHYDELCLLAKENENVTIVKSTNKISDYMRRSDMIFSAGGTTVYEILTIGVPTVLFSIAEDQVKESIFLDEKKVVKYAGYINTENFWNQIFALFNVMLSNFAVRKELNANSKYNFDGKGAERIAQAISVL